MITDKRLAEYSEPQSHAIKTIQYTLTANPERLIKNDRELDEALNKCIKAPAVKGQANVDQSFSELFVGSGCFYVFTNFNMALRFGKAKAHSLGFNIRIKTSSHNIKSGTTFKYIVSSI